MDFMRFLVWFRGLDYGIIKDEDISCGGFGFLVGFYVVWVLVVFLG